MSARRGPHARRRRHAPALVALGVGLTAGTGGCGSAERDVPRVERTDSSGLEIVSSHAPAWGPEEGWRLAAEPSLEIGLDQGAEEYLLEGVLAASVRADGHVVVCNRSDRTVRRYDARGNFVNRAGGQGDGPTELRVLNGCFFREGQTWAYQAPALPLKVYDLDGGLVTTVALPRPGERPAVLAGVYGDGSLLLRQDEALRELPLGLGRLTTTLVRALPDPAGGAFDTLGVFPSGDWMRSDQVRFPAAFSPALYTLVRETTVLLGWSEAFDIAEVGAEGRVLRRLRRSGDSRPVSAVHRAAFEERVLNGSMPAGDLNFQALEIRRTIVDMMQYPMTLPAHYRLLADREGHLWVERADAPRDPLPAFAEPYAGATTWDVFDGDGVWLGAVEMPPAFEVLEVGREYVLGVHHDALGLERVRRYELAAPPGA